MSTEDLLTMPMRNERPQQDSDAQTEAIYFPVSVTKLVVMNFSTWGVYQFYWFYENWKLIQEREQSEVSPFWRTFFAFICCCSLFDKFQSTAASLQIRQPISPLALATGWVVSSMLFLLPDPYWLVNFLSVLFLIPVPQTVNRINESLAPRHDRNERFSAWNKVAVVIGGALFIVGVIGVFLVKK